MPHPAFIAPHLLLWEQNKEVIVMADTMQVIHVPVMGDADTLQRLYSPHDAEADLKQVIYISAVVDADSRQIIFSAHQVDADAKQIIYAVSEALADILVKLRSDGFWFNNDHLWDHDGDLLTESVFDGIPEVSEVTLDVPGHPGAYFFGAEDGERLIRLRLRFDIPTTHQDKMREVSAWLNTRAGEAELKFDAEPDKVYYMRVARKWQLPGTPLRAELDVEFKGSDPYAYGSQVAQSSTGASPRALALSNQGTIETPVVITLNPAAGAVTAVTLTLGAQTMTVAGPFTQALTIDTAKMTAVTGGANAAGQIGGDWLTIPPGGSILNVSWTGDNITVAVSFRPRWL
jgi:predicted phage tail component-like protein